MLPTMNLLATVTRTQWLSLAVSLVIGYVLARCTYLVFFHPASKFPGPKFSAVSNVSFAFYALKGRWLWRAAELIEEYGPVVRVAPNELVFATPQAAHNILDPVVKGQETWVKTDIMDFDAGDGGFIWEQDPVKRKEVAKKILPAFSTRALKAKEPTVQMYTDLFIEKMKLHANDEGGVNLNQWLIWLAMDMSADLSYGRELNQMRDGDEPFPSLYPFSRRPAVRALPRFHY
ncbi:cytochrome P450 [Xylariaceae sp. FL0594]|nr:cytochrome P450 [Xylariaceae sp. FL0594]